MTINTNSSRQDQIDKTVQDLVNALNKGYKPDSFMVTQLHKKLCQLKSNS